MFNSMILPILNYGCEVWRFHKAPNTEGVYSKYLKQTLHLRYQTTYATVYGKFRRVPLHIERKRRILKYWYKIVSSPESLIYKCFIVEEVNEVKGSWAVEIRS